MPHAPADGVRIGYDDLGRAGARASAPADDDRLVLVKARWRRRRRALLDSAAAC